MEGSRAHSVVFRESRFIAFLKELVKVHEFETIVIQRQHCPIHLPLKYRFRTAPGG